MKPTYRVWDIKNERMIYSHAYERWGIIDHTKDSTLTSVGSKSIFLSDNPEYFVWMSFLGIKDSDGNDIYEFDILQDEWHENNYGCPYIEEGQINFGLGVFENGSIQAQDSHKIGNKFENKDLYEKVKKFI